MKIRFSIIIPVLVLDKQLERCLRSILRSVGPRVDVEVLVINNAPLADGPRLSAVQDERIRVLEEGKPGAYAARNTGIKHARGECILFCDADCEVSFDWFARLTAVLDSHEVVCGRWEIACPRRILDIFQARIARRWESLSANICSFKGSVAGLKKEIF